MDNWQIVTQEMEFDPLRTEIRTAPEFLLGEKP